MDKVEIIRMIVAFLSGIVISIISNYTAHFFQKKYENKVKREELLRKNTADAISKVPTPLTFDSNNLEQTIINLENINKILMADQLGNRRLMENVRSFNTVEMIDDITKIIKKLRCLLKVS